MAMICVKGGECDGCMSCQEPRPERVLCTCDHCGETILVGEPRYELPDGAVVHDDCMIDYVKGCYYRED